MELKNYFKTLSIIHLFLVLGLAVFTGFVLFQNKGFKANTNEDNVFLYIVPIAALIGYFGSQLVVKKLMGTIKRTATLQQKLSTFQSSQIIKFACIEAPAILGLFAYYSSGNALPLVISICLLAYLVVQRPNKERLLRFTPLTPDERRLIEKI